MKKIKLFQKKVIIPLIIVIVIIVGISIGVYFYNKNNVKEVSVYSLNDIGMTDFWQDSNQTEGVVKEDKTQSVYLSETQTVDKILVKEGDTVKKGTPLIKYSTTLTNLELEKKQIDIRKMELELDNAKKKLEEIKNYQPNTTVNTAPDNVAVTNNVEIAGTLISLSKPLPEVQNEMVPAPLTGEGTLEKPYIFLWSNEKEYDKAFIESLIARAGDAKTEVYATFIVRENMEVSGAFISASMIKFTKKLDEYTFSIIKNYSSEEDPLYIHNEEVIEEPSIPEVIENVTASYTAEEIKKMVLEKEKEISELILNIKVAQSEYNTLQNEVKDTTVYSKIDGVIKTVLSLESPDIKTKPVIVVSGGGGYYITGSIGELNLDQIKVGQKVTAMSYSTGAMAEGVVTEISDIPLSNFYGFGMGNTNVSYYPYTVFVSEEGAFKENDYVQLSPEQEIQSEPSLYLSKAFVLEENGKNYVYVSNSEGKLEKRQILVNGSAYEYLKIKSGITAEDKVAFPYGKKVKEGMPTVDGSLEELYSGF